MCVNTVCVSKGFQQILDMYFERGNRVFDARTRDLQSFNLEVLDGRLGVGRVPHRDSDPFFCGLKNAVRELGAGTWHGRCRVHIILPRGGPNSEAPIFPIPLYITRGRAS